MDYLDLICATQLICYCFCFCVSLANVPMSRDTPCLRQESASNSIEHGSGNYSRSLDLCTEYLVSRWLQATQSLPRRKEIAFRRRLKGPFQIFNQWNLLMRLLVRRTSRDAYARKRIFFFCLTVTVLIWFNLEIFYYI